jgi:hypothetical protein
MVVIIIVNYWPNNRRRSQLPQLNNSGKHSESGSDGSTYVSNKVAVKDSVESNQWH